MSLAQRTIAVLIHLESFIFGARSGARHFIVQTLRLTSMLRTGLTFPATPRSSERLGTGSSSPSWEVVESVFNFQAGPVLLDSASELQEMDEQINLPCRIPDSMSLLFTSMVQVGSKGTEAG